MNKVYDKSYRKLNTETVIEPALRAINNNFALNRSLPAWFSLLACFNVFNFYHSRHFIGFFFNIIWICIFRAALHWKAKTAAPRNTKPHTGNNNNTKLRSGNHTNQQPSTKIVRCLYIWYYHLFQDCICLIYQINASYLYRWPRHDSFGLWTDPIRHPKIGSDSKEEYKSFCDSMFLRFHFLGKLFLVEGLAVHW